MKNHLKKIRKSSITKEEIIADAIFLFIPACISFLGLFIFDIHHSLYERPMTLQWIFKTPYPYILFIPIGTIIGFFIIKLMLFGIKEEQK